MGADWYTFTSVCGIGKIEQSDKPEGEYCYPLTHMTLTDGMWAGVPRTDEEEVEELEQWLNVVFDEALVLSHHVMGCYDTSKFLRISVVAKGPMVLLSIVK